MNSRTLFLWLPALIFTAIILFVFLNLSGVFGNNTAHLTVSNRSASELTDIRIYLYEVPCLIPRLLPGEQSLCEFSISRDGHYTIQWKGSERKAHHEEIGYVTGGPDIRQVLSLGNDGKADLRHLEQ